MGEQRYPPASCPCGVRSDCQSAKLVPEQRIVGVWNQYVREIGAPDETIVSVAEIHNLRDASYTIARLMWARGTPSIWTMPILFALGSDGKVADGC
ncbi:MAG: hypothetical protein ABSD75_16135 [Terriglobales bacterium]|jgi:hypothetical protein